MVFTPPCKIEPAVNPHHHRQPPMLLPRHSHGQAKFPLTHLQARIRSEQLQQMRQILRTNAAILPRIDNLPLPIFHHLRHPKPGITGINNPVEQTGTVPQLLPNESSPCHILNFHKFSPILPHNHLTKTATPRAACNTKIAFLADNDKKSLEKRYGDQLLRPTNV